MNAAKIVWFIYNGLRLHSLQTNILRPKKKLFDQYKYTTHYKVGFKLQGAHSEFMF